MKAAIFSCKGLGDGLLALVLSNNLARNSAETTTFHPFLQEMQEWFPHLPLRPFPAIEALDNFDQFFFIYEKTPWMQALLTHCQSHYPDRTHVLNPIATRNRDYPYWEVGRFDGALPFVDNLQRYCRNQLKIEHAVRENGIVPPPSLEQRRYPKRVIIHPTSSREGKNWSKEKYLSLRQQLIRKGYDPVFMLTQEEKKNWPEVDSPHFSTLSALAAFVYESGSMIGNDSGIGHLASSLGLPTLTICRSRDAADFWRPAWAPGALVFPPLWLPNLKGLRWRDRYWKQWISPQRVLHEFEKIKGVSHGMHN